MYKVVMTMWVNRRITAAKIDALVLKGLITSDEAETILSTPQI